MSGTQDGSLSDIFTARSSKRSPDSQTNTAPTNKRHKLNPNCETPSAGDPKKPADEKFRDWEKATLKPMGNTKLETDTCLTCIQQGRICGGTTLTDKGKCQNCDGVGNGYKKRVCYWKEEGIETYAQAQKKYNGRTLPSNTREGVAARRARKETPSTTTIDPVQDAQISVSAFPATFNSRDLGPFPQQ